MLVLNYKEYHPSPGRFVLGRYETLRIPIPAAVGTIGTVMVRVCVRVCLCLCVFV